MNKFKIGRRYKKEFKRQARSLIIITLGFTIAFTWRQTIFDLSQSLVQLITKTNGSGLSILTSTFITILSVILILTTTHFLKNEEY